MIANATTFLENMKWTLYPSHIIGNSSFQSMHIDIFNLLGLDVDLQQTMIRKIDSFLGRMAHIVLVDMIKHMKHQDLADIWYILVVDATNRAQLDEVNIFFSYELHF